MNKFLDKFAYFWSGVVMSSLCGLVLWAIVDGLIESVVFRFLFPVIVISLWSIVRMESLEAKKSLDKATANIDNDGTPR